MNRGIVRILDSTTKAAPKMTEALADYGNGRMGDGILNLIEWVRQDSKAIWLARGRFQGAAVVGAISTVSFATVSFFMHRQLKKEEVRNQEVIGDLFDEILAYRSQQGAFAVEKTATEEEISGAGSASANPEVFSNQNQKVTVAKED